MSKTAQIDVADGEEPHIGEKFVISLQENSEMLGLLDDGRTFLFTSPPSVEHDYQQESRALTIVDFDLDAVDIEEMRLVGSLTYSE